MKTALEWLFFVPFDPKFWIDTFVAGLVLATLCAILVAVGKIKGD